MNLVSDFKTLEYGWQNEIRHIILDVQETKLDPETNNPADLHRVISARRILRRER